VSDSIDLAAEVERLRADLDRALTDGAASHGRYLAADSDYRHQSEKAAKHWQERCQAITERDDARLALAMARGDGWPEGVGAPRADVVVTRWADPHPPRGEVCARRHRASLDAGAR
jgi:hypothetical protein